MNAALRRLFPVTRNYVYLNHAAVAPISLPVFEAMQNYTRDLLDHGLIRWEAWQREVERVREVAAHLIHATPQEIAFTPNTSSGLCLISNGLNWRAGENIVTADCEFPANQQPWLRVQKAFGVEIRRAREQSGRISTDGLLSLIDEQTRVVTISFVEFASGFRNDLQTIGEYCRERDVIFVVDAIQGLGALQLDVEKFKIDALSADAHKFLLGPDGVSLTYISNRILEQVMPTVVGWTSVKNAFDFRAGEKEFATGAKRFEPGALNTAGIMGLGAALDMFLREGPQKIEDTVLTLTQDLNDRLVEAGFSVISSRATGEASAIVCCTHPKYSADELASRLEAEKIVVTARLGRLRISPHFYNSHEEIDQIVAALQKIVRA